MIRKLDHRYCRAAIGNAVGFQVANEAPDTAVGADERHVDGIPHPKGMHCPTR